MRVERSRNRQSDSATGSPLFSFASGFDASSAPNIYQERSHTWTSLTLGVLINALRAENEALKMENQQLKDKVGQNPLETQIVKTRVISRKRAKEEISRFFVEHHGEVIYPSDIAEELNLSYFVVEEIIEDLENEGEIRRASK
jgi:regulator of replication initiation timing